MIKYLIVEIEQPELTSDSQIGRLIDTITMIRGVIDVVPWRREASPNSVVGR